MKHTKRIFNLQCWIIGVNPKKVDGTKHDWYSYHTWPATRERAFIFLVTLYLWLNKRARREVMRFPRSKWNRCKAAAKEWAWNYGWYYSEVGPKKYVYVMAFIGWLGIFTILAILAIRAENKEIPQYNAVWRGVVADTTTTERQIIH